MKKRYSLIVIVVLFFTLTLSACNCKNIKNSSGENPQKHFYEINAYLNTDYKLLECEMRVDYVNKFEKSKNYIEFDLYPNAFSQNSFYKPVSFQNINLIYPEGISYGSVKINSVKNKGNNLFYELVDFDSVLRIYPQEKIKSGEVFSAEIDFTVQFPCAFHRLGFYDNCFNAGNFYPSVCQENDDGFVHGNYHITGDPFDSDYADYEVYLNVPQNYLVAHSATAERETINGKRKTIFIKGQDIKDFAFSASQNYKKISGETSSGTVINYYYLNEKFSETVLRTALKGYEFFNEAFCNTEKKKFDIAQTYLFSGGMEYSEMIMLSTEIFTDEYVAERIALHETAHQWWYYLIGSNQKFSPWIDEGLSEFSVYYYFLNNDKNKSEIFIDEIKSNIAYFENYSGKESDLKPLEDIYYFTGENAELAYSVSVYSASFFFFYNLYSDNKENFIGNLNNLCEDFKYKSLSQNEFISYIEQLKNFKKYYQKLSA